MRRVGTRTHRCTLVTSAETPTSTSSAWRTTCVTTPTTCLSATCATKRTWIRVSTLVGLIYKNRNLPDKLKHYLKTKHIFNNLDLGISKIKSVILFQFEILFCLFDVTKRKIWKLTKYPVSNSTYNIRKLWDGIARLGHFLYQVLKQIMSQILKLKYA